MSNARDDDFTSAMRADIVRVLVKEAGAPETHAMALASKIMVAVSHRWQGTEPYIRQPARYDERVVLADLERMPPGDVCKKHSISRWTVQRLRRRAVVPTKNIGSSAPVDYGQND